MNRLSLIFAGLLCTILPLSMSAQSFQEVFPNLSGQTLFDSLVSHYKPTVVLDYGTARDTLYSKVFAIDDDSVRCIYSGHTLYLDPTQDPTQYVYQGGASSGMNAEHAYPQAKGAADGNARSDMHHLYPVRIPCNDARGDFPYGEIPDASTQKWFRNNQTLTSIPTQNIDQYSEFKTGFFEPREASKGDIARAVFYFFTIYHPEAIAADPNFFESQRPTLCQWSEQDPADAAELIKTWRIAHYQENKPNPYILDCTLAYRMWCPQTIPACTQMAVNEPVKNPLQLSIYPQPSNGNLTLEMQLPFDGRVHARVFSITGQELAIFEWENAAAGTLKVPVELPASSQSGPWAGFLEVRLSNQDKSVGQMVPIIDK